MKPGRWTVTAILLSFAFAGSTPASDPPQPVARHRVIILSDIENEPDDTQSFVRLLLYSNQIDIDAMVATTSVHMKDGVHADSIRAIIKGYGQVRANLLKHEGGFPTEDDLQRRVLEGQPGYGMAAVGEGKDSPGATRIIRALDSADARPLWISVWGGANTLAQALFTLRATRSEPDLQRLLARLRVYTISDQDDAGAWIRRTFPTLFYIVSPGGYGQATWGGIHEAVNGLDNETISNAWLAKHIQQGHGAYGALYPDVAYGMEGDTPSWLALVPNGLGDPEHPEWGGWGGRYELSIPARADTEPEGFTGGVPVEVETRPIWTNATDTVAPYERQPSGRAFRPAKNAMTSARATLWRWRDDFQHDFAARIAWTTQSGSKANHPPVARLAHPDRLSVKAGESFFLDATRSSDPDGDSLSFRWFNYPEAGSLKAAVPVQGAENTRRVRVVTPGSAGAGTLHYILVVTDKGEPSLSRYRRVIVTVIPAH
jgi:hypothetical protein